MKKLLRLFFSFIIVSFLALLSIVPVHAAPPANFQTSLVIGTGLAGPSGFEIAPDGRIFILQRTGEVKIYKNEQLLSQNFTVLPSVASGDRGLIGIAFDPDFLTNHYVYFYYTALDLHNYLVRFDASGDTAANGPVILYQTPDQSFQLHVGGTIRFGPDGKLYVSIGDNGYSENSQDLTNAHGKILRLNKDGSIPMDNPFVGKANILPEIYAYGFRNPFRFVFDKVTGAMFEGDVGEATWEEVNHVLPGKNYGWPRCEGYCSPFNPLYADPIHAYNHDGGSAAVMVGPVYYGQMFPSSYQGRLFFADYAKGFIKTMALDTNGNNLGVTDFDTNAGSVVEMQVDRRDGALYYITYYPGALYKVTYSTGTKVPTANATADVTKGTAPLTVHFSSQGSGDPNGLPITYDWDFGDGTKSTEANPIKVYNTNGKYTVQLKVSNGTYTNLANPLIIQVGIPPTVTIGQPTDGVTYKAGDQILVTASATDGAGFDISDGSLATTIVFHHQTHIHPFLGPLTGRTHTFTTPTTGEVSADTWFEISVTATDTSGLSSTATVNIYPQKVNLSFATQPANLQITLDGQPFTTPQMIPAVVNFVREFSAPLTQTATGKVYQFDHWSDGGGMKHTISTPSTDTTYTAYFKEITPWTGQYFNNMTLAGDPVLTRQDTSIDFNWDQGSPDPSLPVDQFSVRWTNTLSFAAGSYTVSAATDDGVRVWIDNNLVIDAWYDQGIGVPHSATVDLTAGNHTIKMEYYENAGGAAARLTWDVAAGPTPSPAPPPGSYQAEYFANMTLAGTPVLTRSDEAINFDFGGGSPDAAVPVDKFSARWTKDVQLTAGDYTFTATADDGVRVYLDNTLVIDKWLDQGATTYTVTKTVSEGMHTIKVEYYENTGGAVIKFTYVGGSGGTPPTGTETKLGGMNLSGYCESKNLGGAMLVNDNWVCTGNNTQIDMTAACVWQYNDTHATAKQDAPGNPYTWACYTTSGGTPPPPTQTTAYQASFWNVPGTGSMPTVPATTPTLTRTDATIDFDFGGGSPDVTINPDHFVARWVKKETFTAGTYHLTTISDDGIRVYIDNSLIIDFWTDHGATTMTKDISLADGEHEIKVEYYENGGGAVVKFNYGKVSDTTTPPPPAQAGGFLGEYFANMTLTGTPTFTRTDDAINFIWNDLSPDPRIPADRFSVRWTKDQDFAAGTYTFVLKSDDGIRFWIDSTLLVDDWTDHALRTYSPTVTLSGGMHKLKIEYYENAGGAVATFAQQ